MLVVAYEVTLWDRTECSMHEDGGRKGKKNIYSRDVEEGIFFVKTTWGVLNRIYPQRITCYYCCWNARRYKLLTIVTHLFAQSLPRTPRPCDKPHPIGLTLDQSTQLQSNWQFSICKVGFQRVNISLDLRRDLCSRYASVSNCAVSFATATPTGCT